MNFPPNPNDERSKMNTSTREKDFQAKQEGGTNESKFYKASPSSSRQWSAFKNPRIVRVSRSFGGKDRHSKVCTIRGLRDRRIRLSVPTAIQLYDLQDRLGLSQPSKVVDWLIDATKHEIDKLPPLQMPQGNFSQFHEPNASLSSLSPFFNPNPVFLKEEGTQSLRKEGFMINQNIVGYDPVMARSKENWDSIANVRGKSKEVEKETIVEKTKWFKANDHHQENQDGIGAYTSQVSAQNFFPIANHSSFPTFLNTSMPYNPYYHLEPPNLSLSQFGGHGFSSQTEDFHPNTHSVALPSSLALSSGPPLFFCQSSATPSLFPPYPSIISTPIENDLRQMNHFQLLSSNSQPILPNPFIPSLHSMKSSPLNLNPKVDHLHSQNNDESQPNKGNNCS